MQFTNLPASPRRRARPETIRDHADRLAAVQIGRLAAMPVA
jgi:hypothetical protein